MKLHSLLSQELIITKLESTSRDGVLEEIVDFLKEKNKVSRSKDLFEKLIQRENLGSTAIGEGVAIPHCKLKGVKSPIFALGISKAGVDFMSLDGKPAHVFFLVVSSPENPSMNLQALAAIARLVRKAVNLPARILEAENPKKIIEIVREEEERLND